MLIYFGYLFVTVVAAETNKVSSFALLEQSTPTNQGSFPDDLWVNTDDIPVEDNYYYDGEEFEPPHVDLCSFYDTEHALNCHHDKFPSTPILELAEFLEKNITKTCCAGHAYLFVDGCQERTTTYGTEACGYADGSQDPVLPHAPIICPLHCAIRSVERRHMSFDADGIMRIRPNVVNAGSSAAISIDISSHVIVTDFCLSYRCTTDDDWAPSALACICYDPALLTALNEEMPESLRRCCPGSLQVKVTDLEGRSPGETEHSPDLICPNSETQNSTVRDELNEKYRVCHNGGFVIHDFRYAVDVSDVESTGKVRLRMHSNTTVAIDDKNYCVGLEVEEGEVFNVEEGFRKSFMHCPLPCGGKIPCIRTCCGPEQMYTEDSCSKISQEVKNNFFQRTLYDDDISVFKNFSNRLRMDNFDQIHYKSKFCRIHDGYTRDFVVEPAKRCKDKFVVEMGEGGVVVFKMLHLSPDEYQPDTFCLNVNADKTLSAEVCTKRLESTKFKFYPYVLLSSCAFLMLTFVVYTIYPKLLNYYTRLVRHFIALMFCAFIVLSINQLVSFYSYSPTLCQIMGFLELFLFLAFFNLMAAMGVEVWLQLSGKPGNEKRYRLELVFGYGFPCIILLSAVGVEFLAPSCSRYTPQFGEDKCFFNNQEAKIMFFYLPIAVYLVINAFMFCATITAICSLERQKKKLKVQSTSMKNETTEKFLMYLKLFLGMGFIWTFEIVAGVTDNLPESTWYVTDVLNMLQGFYVFVIFICKRNVLNVIRGKNTKHSAKTGKSDTKRLGFKLVPIKGGGGAFKFGDGSTERARLSEFACNTSKVSNVSTHLTELN